MDEALNLIAALPEQPQHFVLNLPREGVGRQRLPGAFLTRVYVATRRVRPEYVAVQVAAVIRLRLVDSCLVETALATKMSRAVHELPERMRVPAHASHTTRGPHELHLFIRVAVAVVIEHVTSMRLLAAQANVA